MDASMDQKAGFLSAHLLTDPGARILDLGCGSGALSARLATLAPLASVMGVDIDPGTIEQAGTVHRLPNLRFIVGDAAARWEPADAVVSCSLLHHVFTYAPRPYDEAAAEAALRAHVASTAADGLLVVRDFCTDGAPEETCLLDLSDLPRADGRSDANLLRDFAARARPLDPLGTGFPLEELGEPAPGWRRFRLHRRWSAEFLLRKDYRDDWEAELREQYAFWPLRRFADIVEEAGARVTYAAEVRNPWVVRHRFEGKARRWDEHLRALPWPATNMILVAHRGGPGRALRLRHQRVDPEPPRYLSLTGWRESSRQEAETLDLVRRPTGAVDFLPYAMVDGRLRVLVRNGWPRPATVVMGRNDGGTSELWSGHVVEPISLASDGADMASDFRARCGFALPPDPVPEQMLAFLPSAGTADEVTRSFAIRLDALPTRGPAPAPPGEALDYGVLQSFDAGGLLRAAEVGMVPGARLELLLRVLWRRMRLPAGGWVGEPQEAPRCGAAPAPWRLDNRAAALFVPTSPGGFLRLVRSVFRETRAGSGGPVPGGEQVLELALPSRHASWTVSVLPVGTDLAGDVVVGLEKRSLPSAQLGFGSPGIDSVPAWRVDVLPDAADPLRVAAASASGCDGTALTVLGAPYYPSLGVSPERVQPFTVPIDLLPSEDRAKLTIVRLTELLDAAETIRDGHLLLSAFRLGCALDL